MINRESSQQNTVGKKHSEVKKKMFEKKIFSTMEIKQQLCCYLHPHMVALPEDAVVFKMAEYIFDKHADL